MQKVTIFCHELKTRTFIKILRQRFRHTDVIYTHGLNVIRMLSLVTEISVFKNSCEKMGVSPIVPFNPGIS